MPIRSVDSIPANPLADPVAAASANQELGKEDFLKLLVTQMEYQDPLNPTDSTEFTAQLAQFSSLEQLFQMNSNLGGLVDSQVPSGMASVAGFLDREILAKGDSVRLTADGATPVQFSLDGHAEVVNAVIRDQNDLTVRTISLGALDAGAQQGVWDGLDNTGQSLPDGNYRFSILAQDANGNTVGTRTEVRGRVTGAVYEDGEALLSVGSRRVPLTDLIAVKSGPAA